MTLAMSRLLSGCGTPGASKARLWCVLGGVLTATVSAAQAPRMNVLFIAVDDLRPQLGCYGDPVVKSPCIDRLARSGLVFNRAYCQQAVCSPSRTSLLTGLRPDTTRIYDLNTHFRKTVPNAVTLPEHFRKNGYHTQSLGKIYHADLDDPQSWSVPYWMPERRFPTYATEENLLLVKMKTKQMRIKGEPRADEILEEDPKTHATLKIKRHQRALGRAWEIAEVPDNALPDGQVADHAVEVLRTVKDSAFFLAVGFFKPHLPFVAPKKYYDLYPPEAIKIASNPDPPTDAPDLAMSDWGELRHYEGIPKKGPLPEETARQLIRGYRAATSYTDAQIGRVLDELDRLGLRERTLIVLWGDHGWHLGEHGLWCKHTNFEEATRSLLILSVPGCPKATGVHTDALVEFVDIYPTLSELCGLPRPEGLEGLSMAPLLNDPNRAWKKAAFSQFPRRKTMGHSVRTDRFRYTEWAVPGQEPVGVELYDHQVDPGENRNIARQGDMKDRVQELRQLLHAGYTAAWPPGASVSTASRPAR